MLMKMKLTLQLKMAFMFVLLFGSFGFVTSPAQAADTFTNPIKTGAADPFVTWHDGWYYMLYTQVDRIDIWKSQDLTQIASGTSTRAFTPPASGWGSKNIWAPELHRINGKWYLYYTADDGTDANHRMFVLENSASDPTSGTWVSKGQVNTPNSFAIDGTVFENKGTLYFVWANRVGVMSLWISAMSDPWTLTGTPVKISSPTYSWEPNVNEGPAVLQRNGRIFMTYSGNGCGSDDYLLGLLTADENANLLLADSWVKSTSPVFSKANGVYGPGHNSFTRSPDGTEDWIVYHGNSVSGAGCTGARSARIQKVTWREDGTPFFGKPVGASVSLVKPSTGNPSDTDDVLFKIINLHSGKAVSVPGINPNPGGQVGQWTYEGNPDQQWTLEPSGDGYYKIRAYHSNMVLEVEGASLVGDADVIQNFDTNATHQQWKLLSQGNGYYSVQNRNSGQMLDLSGGNLSNGARFAQWPDNGLSPQRFRFEPIGDITMIGVESGKAVNVVGGSTANGANIALMDDNGCSCQKWRFESLGNGYFKVINRNSGQVIDIAGMSNTNGANIQQWPYLNNAGQHWRLLFMPDGTVSLRPQLNGLRVMEASGTANNANIRLYDALNTPNQLWWLMPH
ncbi:family 43 glycosylhydrolase [Paenibacillus ginsengarvi]|uniref:Glycosyl hydrolase n=1 Tax=Paenibacillus ginsengarvi TaxID=400777 RepID=A0A3B0CGT5_9BACL|nr:family 43 glycosylhydrolase [Paenibacillus ginsengarvi]RKN84542.1 glycosyl hydrolase [Paenibacillus ginsengarvi]